MRKLFVLCLLVVAMIAPSIAFSSGYVQGYTRSDGTYVNGYYRSSPDQYKYNNYSSQGNYNPYSGTQGTQRNEFSTNPSYNNSYGNGYGKTYNNLYNNPTNNSLYNSR